MYQHARINKARLNEAPAAQKIGGARVPGLNLENEG